jgi:hypothetical protein
MVLRMSCFSKSKHIAQPDRQVKRLLLQGLAIVKLSLRLSSQLTGFALKIIAQMLLNRMAL